jgi:hypothetical protein
MHHSVGGVTPFSATHFIGEASGKYRSYFSDRDKPSPDPETLQITAGRFDRRRLDAESIRDMMLDIKKGKEAVGAKPEASPDRGWLSQITAR